MICDCMSDVNKLHFCIYDIITHTRQSIILSVVAKTFVVCWLRLEFVNSVIFLIIVDMRLRDIKCYVLLKR